jgi:hypothetical protein
MHHDDAHNRAMKEHEERGCPCTKPTLEGARLRAGQFWEGDRDRRYTEAEWADILQTLIP